MNTTNGAATGKTYSKQNSTWGCEGDRPVLRVRHPMSGRVEIVDLTDKVVDGQSVPGFYMVVDRAPAAQPAPAPEVETVDASHAAAATDVGIAQAVLLETLTRASETGAELSVPELADRAPAATGNMIAACMAGYRIVPTSRFDRGCRCFTVGDR